MRNRTQPTAALLATLALLTGGAGFTTRSSAAAPPLEASVDAYLRPYLDLNVFQGVVLVARGDRILLEKGYGYANVELAVRNTPDRVFRIASLTKPFTQVALGRLVEEKRLALSDPLARYLPDFPNGDRITLEMLRTHKAGIPNLNSIPFDEEARGSNTLDSLVRLLARQPLTFEPGSRTRYSNGGYALLGAVIEKVTGMSYGDYLARAVLGPLALTHTRHEADGTLVPNRAYGYTVSGGDRRVLVTPPFQEMNTKTGGGSLVSTAGDLHRFLRAMNRDNVIRAATWKLLFGDDSTFSYQGRCTGIQRGDGARFRARRGRRGAVQQLRGRHGGNDRPGPAAPGARARGGEATLARRSPRGFGCGGVLHRRLARTHGRPSLRRWPVRSPLAPG